MSGNAVVELGRDRAELVELGAVDRRRAVGLQCRGRRRTGCTQATDSGISIGSSGTRIRWVTSDATTASSRLSTSWTETGVDALAQRRQVDVDGHGAGGVEGELLEGDLSRLIAEPSRSPVIVWANCERELTAR